MRMKGIRKHFCADLLDLNTLCFTAWLNQFLVLLESKIMAEKIRMSLKFTDNFGKCWNLVHVQFSTLCFSGLMYNVLLKIFPQIEIVCLTFNETVSSMKDQIKWNKSNAYKFGLRELAERILKIFIFKPKYKISIYTLKYVLGY